MAASVLLFATFNAKAEVLSNNVTGTVGLNGNLFGSGKVSVSYGNGIPVGVDLDSSGTYGLNVQLGKPFSIGVSMTNFQNTSGSSLRQGLSNLAPLTEGELATYDLRHDTK